MVREGKRNSKFAWRSYRIALASALIIGAPSALAVWLETTDVDLRIIGIVPFFAILISCSFITFVTMDE